MDLFLYGFYNLLYFSLFFAMILSPIMSMYYLFDMEPGLTKKKSITYSIIFFGLFLILMLNDFYVIHSSMEILKPYLVVGEYVEETK